MTDEHPQRDYLEGHPSGRPTLPVGDVGPNVPTGYQPVAVDYVVAPDQGRHAGPDYTDDPHVSAGPIVRPYVLPAAHLPAVPEDLPITLTLTAAQWKWLDIGMTEMIKARDRLHPVTDPEPPSGRDVRALYYDWCSQVLRQMRDHEDEPAPQHQHRAGADETPCPVPGCLWEHTFGGAERSGGVR